MATLPAMRKTLDVLLAHPPHRLRDLLVRAVGGVEAHDPAPGVDDPLEPLAKVPGHAQRGSHRAHRRHRPRAARAAWSAMAWKRGRMPERAVLAEARGTCRRRTRPASANRSAAPTAAAARTPPTGTASVRCGSDDRTPRHQRHVVEIEGSRQVGKQLADRGGNRAGRRVASDSLWNTRHMSELADRATDVAARIAELQGHL